MDVFINNITSFPVIVFTCLFAIIIVYWLLAIIGAVDIEMFDGGFDLDIDADVDLDMDAEGLSGVTGFMLKWGLTGMPVTVVISILVATAWLVCYVFVSVIYPLLPFESFKSLIGFVLLFLSFMLAIPVTAQIIRPMRGLFKSHSAASKTSFIGCECVVKSGKVTPEFGQAEFNDGEAGMLFDVRSESAYDIKKGDLVILHKYDAEDDSYWVIKATELD